MAACTKQITVGFDTSKSNNKAMIFCSNFVISGAGGLNELSRVSLSYCSNKNSTMPLKWNTREKYYFSLFIF